MRPLLPHPLMAAVLLAMWLLLNQSLSPGHIVLGAIVAILSSHGLAALRPEPVRFRTVGPAFRLAGIVALDIVRSNMDVARIILFNRKHVSGFVRLPLDLTNITGLAILACIITATPGTIWVQFDRVDRILLVHVLDLVDEDEWIRMIKNRYESLLMEVFGQ